MRNQSNQFDKSIYMTEEEKIKLYNLISETRDNQDKWNEVKTVLETVIDLNTPVDLIYGNTIGKLIIEHAPLEVTEYALKKGGNPNIPNTRYSKTPLFYISTLEELVLLHKYKADLNYTNEDGRSYLSDMIYHSPELFYEHLKLGGNFKHARSVLFEFCTYHLNALKENRCLELIELMSKNGLNINDYSSAGITALHYATITLSYQIIELLIKLGADINQKTLNEFEFQEEFIFPKGSSAKDLVLTIGTFKDSYDPELILNYEKAKSIVLNA